jgi:drug/metabolite transporter (DMT)-like permease
MKLAFIYLVIAAALYGSISTVAKPTLDSIHPILLSSLTYLIIGIVVTCIIKITGHYYNPTKNDLKLIVLISISGAVFGPILYFYGLTFTNASLASILINAEFIFSIILAVSILKERPTRIGYAGIILIFVGLLITNVDFENQSLIGGNTFIGNILIIAASFFWAVDNNVSNIAMKKGVSVTRLIQLKSLIGGLISLSIWLGLSFSLSFNMLRLEQIPNLLLLSLGGFAGSLFLFLTGMKQVGTIISVMIFSTSSIFGVIFALLLLDELHTEIWKLFLSSITIVCGIFLITRQNR